MADDLLPPEVRQFVLDWLPTIVHLEALVLLHGDPQGAFSADDVGCKLYVQTPVAVRVLDDLVANGLAAAGSAEGTFRYAPATPARAAGVDRVVEAHGARLVPLSRFIHELDQARGLHDFANAFRLRKD